MGTSATKAKAKYNSKNYEKITLTLSPILAEKFKNFALKNNLSQPKFLEEILNFFENNKQILYENEKLKNELELAKKCYNEWKAGYDNLKLKTDNALQKKQNTILEMQTNDNKIAYYIGGFALVIGFILGKIL